MTLDLTGTAPLLRTTVKHDGRHHAPWVVLPTALSASSVLVYPVVFPTEQDRAGLAATIGANPALSLIFGPARDLSTVDGFNAWRSLAIGGFLAALGAVLAVTRATRGQEDSGQAELLASGVLGRASRLATAVGLGLIGSLMIGLVAGPITILCGGDPESSLLLAATFTATGWMFTAVAAVTAQLGSEARTANSMAVGTLGALFLLRGFAYAVEAPSWTVWINPLGWLTETRPAAGNHWWPLLLTVALTAVLLAAALVLQAGRDFGQGLIAPTPGAERGRIRSTWGLALRLNRGTLVVWAVAILALGFVFGRLATSVEELLGSNIAVQHVLASGATTPEAILSEFLVTILSMIGIISAVPGVGTMLHVRSEEMADRVEPVIATAVARPRYYAGNVCLALAAPTIYVLLAATIVGLLISGADLGLSFDQVFGQAIAVVPAVWTITAIAVAVVGARPAVSMAAWIGVVASFALTLLGPTFGLPDWALAISPFWHVPTTTAADPAYLGLAWISLVTAVFVTVGFVGFRRRDLAR